MNNNDSIKGWKLENIINFRVRVKFVSEEKEDTYINPKSIEDTYREIKEMVRK